jgi:hypothetical protein
LKIDDGPPDEGGSNKIADNCRVLNNTAYFVLEEVKKMKQKIKRAARILLPVLCFVALYQIGFAAEGDVDLSQITEPIDALYTIIAVIISAIGVVLALPNFIGLLSALQSTDQAHQVAAALKFGFTILIAAAPWVLKSVLKIGT